MVIVSKRGKAGRAFCYPAVFWGVDGNKPKSWRRGENIGKSTQYSLSFCRERKRNRRGRMGISERRRTLYCIFVGGWTGRCDVLPYFYRADPRDSRPYDPGDANFWTVRCLRFRAKKMDESRGLSRILWVGRAGQDLRSVSFLSYKGIR